MSDYSYRKAKYDTILFRVDKGKHEEYRQAAEDFGIGFWEMIRLAIDTFIAEKSLQDLPVKPVKPPTVDKQPTLSPTEKRLLAAFAKLPKNAQTNLIKILEALSPQQGE